MFTHKQLERFTLSLPGAWLDYPFGPEAAVYKVGGQKSSSGNQSKLEQPAGKMFALIAEKSSPVRISLKCDPKLAEILREKYESVLPGYHLNKKHWNTIICTGQLSKEELHDLIRLSYELVKQTNKSR